MAAYISQVIKGMETGLFTYVAHPDVITFTGDLAVYRREAGRICEASRELDIPLEINMLGLRDSRFYPYKDFGVLPHRAAAVSLWAATLMNPHRLQSR